MQINGFIYMDYFLEIRRVLESWNIIKVYYIKVLHNRRKDEIKKIFNVIEGRAFKIGRILE